MVARWIESQDLATSITQLARHGEMVTPAVEGIDLFKIADRSISEWIPSFKTNADSPVRQPFCSQLEERLMLCQVSDSAP